MKSKTNIKKTFKVLVFGEAAVGKTSLVQSYVNSESSFTEKYTPTIGTDFYINVLEKEKFQFWDAAGQKQFQTIYRPYLEGAHGFILVFDSTKRETFEQLEEWIQKIKEAFINRPIPPIAIISNKIDLQQDKILRNEIEQYAKQIKAKYNAKNVLIFEASAKTGKNVTEAFSALMKAVRQATPQTASLAKTALAQRGPFNTRNTESQPLLQNQTTEHQSRLSCCKPNCVLL
jgi:small GTP-binding protein